MKKILFTMAALLGASLFAGELVLFDASKDADKVRAFNAVLVKTPDGVIMTNPEGKPRPRLEIDGSWDLSEYDEIEYIVENRGSKIVDFQMYLGNEGAIYSGVNRKGINRVIFTLPPNGTFSRKGDIRRNYPHPEVAEKVREASPMHATPFTVNFYNFGFDPSDVKKIRIIVRRDYLGKEEWSLKKVVAHKRENEKWPAWFYMGAEQFFPFIDKYGQFIHKDWKNKIRSEEDFAKQREIEKKDLASNSGAPDRNKWGGWEKGPQFKATGHFRVEKFKGKWWLIDPDGRLFWSHGVVRVNVHSDVAPLDNCRDFFAALPDADDAEFGKFYHTNDELLRPYYTARNIKETYDFRAANALRKYGKNWENDFAEISHKRLKSWGLNTFANSSDKRIFMMRKTPYVDRFEVKASELSGSMGYWWRMSDPYSPEFLKNLQKGLEERKEQLDDPWCIGFFVDNEINWGENDSIAKWTLMSPKEFSAKKTFVEKLRKKYGEIENLNAVWASAYASWQAFENSREEVNFDGAYDDLVEFSSDFIEQYYKVIRTELKKYAPNKLYMGCRFAGIPKNNAVLYIGAKYCDVISYNIYAHLLDDFKLPAGIEKPIMIGEFHFGATDRGLFHGGQVACKDQAERAQRYYDYVKSALKHPQIIGTHWHQFSDQATTGRFCGENFQVGFTDICDTPYEETVEKVREIGYKMYEVRAQ